MKEKRYAINDYEYFNTGGNCMVGITTIADLQENRTLYVYCNEDGWSITTLNYLYFDFDFDDYNSGCTIDSGSWSYNDNEVDEELMSLIKDCRFTFMKDDCKKFDTRYEIINLKEIPDSMLKLLTSHYRSQFPNSDERYLTTDGYSFTDTYYNGCVTVAEEELIADIPLDVTLSHIVASWLATTFGENVDIQDLTKYFAERGLPIMFADHFSQCEQEYNGLAAEYKNKKLSKYEQQVDGMISMICR